eukprot:GEMP01028301.1.p1 GENE.GEMP01028301.1~~GEMP01028301.1.p1  ORF type:complete len:367 (+),score=75.33 GEMP01028301.1:115-1215(+)
MSFNTKAVGRTLTSADFRGAPRAPRASPYDRADRGDRPERPATREEIARFCGTWGLGDEAESYLRDLPRNIFEIVLSDFVVPENVKSRDGLLISFSKRVHEKHAGKPSTRRHDEYSQRSRGEPRRESRRELEREPRRESRREPVGARLVGRRDEKDCDTIQGFARKWHITPEGMNKLQTLDPEVLQRVISDFAPKVKEPSHITSVMIKFADGIAARHQKDGPVTCPLDAFTRTWKLSEKHAQTLRSANPNIQEFVIAYFHCDGPITDVNRKFGEYLDNLLALTGDAAANPEAYTVNYETSGQMFAVDDFIAKYNLNRDSVAILSALSESARFRVLRDFDPPSGKSDNNPIFVAFAQSVAKSTAPIE